MNFLGRLLLILAIAIAGIYCLPDGPEKLQYIAFRLFPTMQNKTTIAKTPANVPDSNYEEEDDEDEDDTSTVSPSQTTTSVPGMTSNSKLQRNRSAIQNVIGKNYLDAVLSSGKLERWNPRSFPLKVYIEAGSGVPSDYVQEVKNAFATWESGTNGFVRFVYTSSPSDAHYKCIFSEPLKNRNCDENGAGTAAYQYFTYKNDGSIEYSIVNFSPYACNGQRWPKEIFYSTALHEIGHGLGLRGHSTNENDLMYPVGTSRDRIKISEADMNTLRAVYSIIPDTTNIPFSEADKKGLITTADYWGENAQRANITIQQIQENIRITPDMPALYIELAEAYKKQGQYNSAIDAYSQALRKIDNPDTASAVLLQASLLYVEIGQFSSADKCLNKILSYGKVDEVAEFYNYIAIQYAEKEDYSSARTYFEKALQVARNEEQKVMIYKNCMRLAYMAKDKVMFDKYQKLLEGR